MAKIRVNLLGTTSVVLTDGSVVRDVGGIKPRQVLEILALALGSPVSKDRLVEQLWGDTPPRTFTATLESYVSLLRRRMGVARGRGSALATTSNGYVLDPDQVEVDLHEFGRLVAPRAGTAEAVLTRTEAAFRLVQGDLLASEPYAEWAADERRHFEAVFVQACNRAAEQALSVDQAGQAVELARRAIGGDGVSESSWQGPVRGPAAGGAPGEAVGGLSPLRAAPGGPLGAP